MSTTVEWESKKERGNHASGFLIVVHEWGALQLAHLYTVIYTYATNPRVKEEEKESEKRDRSSRSIHERVNF